MPPSSNVAASHHSSTDPERRQCAQRTVQQGFGTQDPAKADRSPEAADRIDWARAVLFIVLYLACLAVIWVGASRAAALAVAAGLYGIRMFTLTDVYRRYSARAAHKERH